MQYEYGEIKTESCHWPKCRRSTGGEVEVKSGFKWHKIGKHWQQDFKPKPKSFFKLFISRLRGL